MNAFSKGQVLHLPILAQSRGLTSDAFTVTAVIPGGMGVCARIENESSGSVFALKTVHPDLVQETCIWDWFVQEMKFWLTLSTCDGIVEAYCITRINELPCICVRWMEGGNLRPLLALRDPRFLYSSAYRLARILDWVYTNHLIIHRDLKPENILLDHQQLVYISDWGLARAISKGESLPDPMPSSQKSASRPDLTNPGQFLGTILYASPEQIMAASTVDFRSDIYSFGCILYEWATGHPPFMGRSAEEIAAQHLYTHAPRFPDRSFGMSFGIEDVALQCIEKDPQRRYPSHESLANAISDAAARNGVDLTPYVPSTRYIMPSIGRNEFAKHLRSGALGNRGADGKFFLIEKSQLDPYLREVDALFALGEWQKASDIFGSLFVPEMVRSTPDLKSSQSTAIGYALCLIKLGRPAEAVPILRCLDGAQNKPAEYFVNLSFAYLHLNQLPQAANIAEAGLTLYANDKDMLGNLLIAQAGQLQFAEALATAHARLRLGRDVHSLEEVGSLLLQMAELSKELDFPQAIETYRKAVDLFCEAKQLNPRYTTARFNLAKAWFCLEDYPTRTSRNQIGKTVQAAKAVWYKQADPIRMGGRTWSFSPNGMRGRLPVSCPVWIGW